MTARDGRVRRGMPDLIGQTPLVRLERLAGATGTGPRIHAKLEASNPGGSAKDRPALRMLEAALESGELATGDTVVESSSGNLGVALAALCSWHGLRFICVVDPRVSRQTARLVEAYGGLLQRVDAPDPETGDWLVARRREVDRLVASVPGAWSPGQYDNIHNPAAHAEGTMAEIVDTLDGDLAAVFVATSTTGTLVGCRDHLDARGISSLLVAVDAAGSVLFDGTRGERLLPGFGAGAVPSLAARARPDLVRRVDDLDCVVGARRLARRESLLAGASGGGVVTALSRELHRFDPDDNVVLVLHDSGSRYLDTVYDDRWVQERLGCSPDQLAAHVDAAWGDAYP